MTYFLTDDEATFIGNRLYADKARALSVAKRTAKAREKNLQKLGGSVVYLMLKGNVYDTKVATIFSNGQVI
jgi:hypothetical protein